MPPCWRSAILTVLALSGVITAANITSSTTCGGKCQSLSTTASSWESDQHADPDYSFYTIPSNFSAKLAPGSLLHVEDATNLSVYSVPSGLSMSRIIYTTTDQNGTILPASAYVLWPYTPLAAPGVNNTQYPLVAWAHGTSGVLKACAPSNYRNLQYHFMVPFLLALQGMAVVAPDYAGLGFDSLPSGKAIGHPWLNGPAQAMNMADAITAVRKAFPTELPPTGPFVAMGHSQGGGAAWSFAERLVKKPIPGYKGTVAFAPPTRTFDLLAQALLNSTQTWAQTLLSQQPALVHAVTAVFPSYNDSGMTSLAYDRFHNVLEPLQGCLPTYSQVFADVPLDQLTRPGWNNNSSVERYAQLSETGRKQFKGPLLILQGEDDVVVPLFTVESAVNDTCEMLSQQKWGESLELVTYSAMNHFPVMQASEMKWLTWVKDRFAGKQIASTGCVRNSVKGLKTDSTYESLGPNFLELWASPNEAWKLAL
ncbi:hypothetical protein PV08_09367 [Exophiala spinifera]|uniref:AB hydrolase-1 domain-containing protein n=1 Tax=Exophiala spinifera TaxID=91928 RepID=A0A0D2AZH2_9EURO|nr:uncharacterized protein PV08_09367 [Exophiala spinifera]KIW12093.1 hypothetical protein PV08_09367 [Exophiala spinifera]